MYLQISPLLVNQELSEGMELGSGKIFEVNSATEELPNEEPDLNMPSLEKLKGKFSSKWQKCCEVFSVPQNRDGMFTIACNKLLMEETRNELAGNQDKRTSAEKQDVANPLMRVQQVGISSINGSVGSFEYATKPGLGRKFTGRVKYGALILGSKFLKDRSSTPRTGKPQVVFDKKYDSKWESGYLPEIRLGSPLPTEIDDIGTGGFFKRSKKSHLTYVKRMPYLSGSVWSSEDSAPVDGYTGLGFNNYDYPVSTPIDVKSILDKYQGLEAVYITEEAHFFIDNIGEEMGENGKYKLPQVLSGLRSSSGSSHQTKRGSHNLISKVTEIFKNSGRALSPLGSEETCPVVIEADDEAFDLARNRINELRKYGLLSADSSNSLEPPSMGDQEPILRPLLLVKGSRQLDREEESNSLHAKQSDLNSQSTKPYEDHFPSLSPSIQHGLKDLKLVRRRGDSFTVPVWSNLTKPRLNGSRADTFRSDFEKQGPSKTRFAFSLGLESEA